MPSWPRRSVPTTAAGMAASSTMASRLVVSTRCGLTSMKTRCPWPSRISAEGPKRTISRRFWYQYSASRPVVSRKPPVMVDRNGTRDGCGRIGASAVSRRPRSGSTCTEWDA